MSRAFVKEADGDAAIVDLPERPISAHRNLVTPSGLAQIEAEIVRLRGDVAAAQTRDDKLALATASRDLRYWSSRRTSAEVAESPQGGEIRFGSTVTIARGDGRRQTFKITGEDEADPRRGTLSYIAPLAHALIGKEEGDEVAFMGGILSVLRVDQG